MSTWAAAWRDRDPQTRVVVNRDTLRHEMFGQYSGLTDDQENAITVAETALAGRALDAGKSVAVDATNLENDFRDLWIELAARHGVRHELVTIDTPLEECLRRNRARAAAGGRFVPEQVICDMHAGRAFNALPA
ncbi:AAA family ATPase [Mycolicibacterium llatzerense]|uniref:AAA family ATPase n=1 Tax=Mycolicibacterium llatzerense TaxID=280871 RepID=UPI0021B61060|nr:AAA family ATPase [Mycolicibacterium llatzerense]MCT7373278.1 hypothetical protein [Mycolicibacterium llatzerense]